MKDRKGTKIKTGDFVGLYVGYRDTPLLSARIGRISHIHQTARLIACDGSLTMFSYSSDELQKLGIEELI